MNEVTPFLATCYDICNQPNPINIRSRFLSTALSDCVEVIKTIAKIIFALPFIKETRNELWQGVKLHTSSAFAFAKAILNPSWALANTKLHFKERIDRIASGNEAQTIAVIAKDFQEIDAPLRDTLLVELIQNPPQKSLSWIYFLHSIESDELMKAKEKYFDTVGDFIITSEDVSTSDSILVITKEIMDKHRSFILEISGDDELFFESLPHDVYVYLKELLPLLGDSPSLLDREDQEVFCLYTLSVSHQVEPLQDACLEAMKERLAVRPAISLEKVTLSSEEDELVASFVIGLIDNLKTLPSYIFVPLFEYCARFKYKEGLEAVIYCVMNQESSYFDPKTTSKFLTTIQSLDESASYLLRLYKHGLVFQIDSLQEITIDPTDMTDQFLHHCELEFSWQYLIKQKTQLKELTLIETEFFNLETLILQLFIRKRKFVNTLGEDNPYFENCVKFYKESRCSSEDTLEFVTTINSLYPQEELLEHFIKQDSPMPYSGFRLTKSWEEKAIAMAREAKEQVEHARGTTSKNSHHPNFNFRSKRLGKQQRGAGASSAAVHVDAGQ